MRSVLEVCVDSTASALAAKRGGASRLELCADLIVGGTTPSLALVRQVKAETGLPVIGLIKREYPGFQGRITMTMREVDECMAAGADVVSIDCTDCVRGDGLTPTEFLKAVREEYPNIIIMADCATFEEGVAAHAAGADLVGTTMNGYTPQTAGETGEPNFALVARLVKTLPCPVIAEGRIHTPEQARKMLEIGAWAVVVGGAITRPLEIASRFMAAVRDLPGGMV